MPRTDRECLIGLNLIETMTPRRMRAILERFPSPAAAWRAADREFLRIPELKEVADRIAGGRSDATLERELAVAADHGLEILTVLDPGYPPSLRRLATPPAVLYVRGTPGIETARSIAIVGTRRCSRYGRAVARRLAGDLVNLGLTVVSGLAVGIDGAAHRGALESEGKTVAVLGCGLLQTYPAVHRDLADRIAESGALVSEYPLDMKPARWTFPQRNRILAGLSRGVVVIEAPQRSGALITVRCALDQGKEVFAVPGNITGTASAGTNRLIKDGAKLVEGVEDILNEFPDLAGLLPQRSTEAAEATLSAMQRAVHDLIGLEPIHLDDIIARGRLSPGDAARTVFELQMMELIEEAEGRRYVRKP